MARKRSCAPEFYQDTKLAELGHVARDFYRSTWTWFSCEGRLELDPGEMGKLVYQHIAPPVPVDKVAEMIFLLVMNKNYALYEAEGSYILFIPRFDYHQKTSHKSRCDLPPIEQGRIITDEEEVREIVQNSIEEPTEYSYVPNKPKAPRDTEGAKAVLAYLNERCGRSFRDTAANIDAIAGWLSKGHDQDDIKMVIDHKWREWREKEDMVKFVRPATLFGPKFPTYLEEALEAESRPEEPLVYMADGAGRT
jgi:uncharacterized phage protein (TIGR02220 family)